MDSRPMDTPLLQQPKRLTRCASASNATMMLRGNPCRPLLLACTHREEVCEDVGHEDVGEAERERGDGHGGVSPREAVIRKHAHANSATVVSRSVVTSASTGFGTAVGHRTVN